jgi:hypothetical protein
MAVTNRGFKVVVTVSARRAARMAAIRFDGVMAPIEQGVAAFDQVVAVGKGQLWSHDCSWGELAVLCDGLVEVPPRTGLGGGLAAPLDGGVAVRRR